jgi:predicted transcriptional regulator
LPYPQKKCKKYYTMGEKKIFSTRIDEDRIRALKHLAVDTDKSLGTLLEEAIQDLLKKYEKNPPKSSN